MITQIGIALFGLIALALAQSQSAARRRYAPIFGLAAQPFWVASALVSEQWGILILTLLYSAIWLRWAWTQWVSRTAVPSSAAAEERRATLQTPGNTGEDHEK